MSFESKGIDFDEIMKKEEVLLDSTLASLKGFDGGGCFLVSIDSKEAIELVKKQTYGTIDTPLD